MLSFKRYWYLMSFLFGFVMAITLFYASNGSVISFLTPLFQQNEPTALHRLINGTRLFLIDETNKKIASNLLELSTGVNTQELNTLLNKELPGAPTGNWKAIVATTPQKSEDPIAELRMEKFAESPARTFKIVKSPIIPRKVTNKARAITASAASIDKNKRIVFVYQTHNRESWLSVTSPTKLTKSVEHPTKNMTLIGKKLAEKLSEKGIGTTVNTDDFYQNLLNQGKSYVDSYEESLKAIQAAKKENKNLKYFFDLHRDDKPREKTTVTINGKGYARIFFVVGASSKHSDKNKEFAEELHSIMESKYPGLSRGIIDKGEDGGDGEYNQSVSPNSILLEIGGIENSMKEGYNSVEAFSEVFEEYLSKEH
ncbi:stage II sporulation protein P [Brevibacillus agri]|uniref:stage II sporulation protein P n=1 Tax=Brevibacillus TaxID=55080 RepID=UPI00203A7A44|nr:MULTISPECIES: stage II sporulation protein P [Brevibacillus]MCM3431728.1 stage II sporulation protein P [Brevibacillus invocatus]MED1646184.1 stage II sporulation protein P [Brevibacillus agri]MED1657816.1 stage II sporulation protein P [Brevibacillus agri]MED1690252.1 stage II sporulation protein P [Brevibacillus agri]MED1695460.1 stage II sporulation protein P [Brevibacillus agri]